MTSRARFAGFGGGACNRTRFLRTVLRMESMWGICPSAATLMFCNPKLITCAVPEINEFKNMFDNGYVSYEIWYKHFHK